MVKEVTTFKNEYTGESFSTRKAAEKSELIYIKAEKDRRKDRRNRMINNLAKENDFRNSVDLIQYLYLNKDKIPKFSSTLLIINKLWNEGYEKLSKREFENLDNIVKTALKYIKENKFEVIVKVNNKIVKSFTVTDENIDNYNYNYTDKETENYILLNNIIKGNNKIIYDYTKIDDSTLVKALKKANIDKFYFFTMYLETEWEENLSLEEKYNLINNSNLITNWKNYYYAKDLAKKDGLDWEAISNETKMNYFEEAGIKQWEEYNNILGFDFNKVKDEDIARNFYIHKKAIKEKWPNFKNFAVELLNFIDE